MAVEILPEPPGVRAVFTGVVRFDDIVDAIDSLGDVESTYTICDLTGASTVHWSIEELHQITTKARMGLHRPPGYPCAVVAQGSLIKEMAELYVLVREYLTGTLIPAGSITEIFDDLDPARRWVADMAGSTA